MRIEDLIQNNSGLKEKTPGFVTGSAVPDYLLNDPMVVGYPDLKMQEEIYEYAVQSVLPAVLDPFHPIGIVDIGAGRGDLKAFLGRRYNGISGFDYSGFELNSIHRNIAKVKYNIELYPNDFLSYNMNFYGWGFCIGSLNEDYGLFNLDADSKQQYISRLINVGLQSFSEGMVFVLYNSNLESESIIPFPISLVLDIIPESCAFDINYSRFPGIYRLVIYNEQIHNTY